MAGADWWVVPEGAIGQAIDTFSWNGITHFFGLTGNQAVWTVRQSASKPAHAADVGPFTRKADAQAAADGLNRQENALTDLEQAAGANTQPTATSLKTSALGQVGAFLGDLTSRATWLRIGKVVIGLALIVVGLVQLTHAQTVITSVASAAGRVPV